MAARSPSSSEVIRQDFVVTGNGEYRNGQTGPFAVAERFPRELLPGPDTCGIIITDGFDCLEVQSAPLAKLAGQRRNHLTRRLAHVAMRRIEFGIASGQNIDGDGLIADEAAGAMPARP